MASADFASIVYEISRDLSCVAKRQGHYFFCFNNIVEDLGHEKGKLILAQQSVLKQAENEKNKTKKVGADVEKWLKDAGNLIGSVEKLEEETDRTSTCVFGWFPNCIWQYNLGKKLAKMTQKVAKLHENSDFKYFSRLATLPGMEYHSCDFIYFESTQLAYDQLLEALGDSKNLRVGLYGMGGSGKTAMVKEVGKEVEKSKIFDKVIFAVVSNPLDLRKIQDNIACSLGLKFEEEHEFDRARRLWLRLTSGEKILIILDDVWEKLDFKAIGIPFEDNHKGCKVLLTTRNIQVCASVKCQRMIQLMLLSNEDAWLLFQKHAGITDNSSKALKNLAQEITNQCKGLPMAIAAVASTLKDQPPEDWKAALRTLRNSKSIDDIDEDLIEIYRCLKLSYDNLKSEKAKRLFLLCSLFPHDYEIPVEDLTRYGIGLGLFGDLHSYETLRSQVRVAKNKLLDSCLLLNADNGQYVKMHDLVWDAAQWIAHKEIRVIRGPKVDLEALAEDTSLKENARFLWFHMIDEFPHKLDIPKLKILILNLLAIKTYESSLEVDDTFFEGIKELQVLAIKNEFLWKITMPIPQSIELLVNLRTLCLRYWKLGDITVIESLRRLETLELDHCTIDHLPKGVVELKKLKLLDLSFCRVEKNPFEVLGRLSQLEELCFVETDGLQWKVNGNNATEFFDENCNLTALKRYRVEIGGSCGLHKSNGFINQRLVHSKL